MAGNPACPAWCEVVGGQVNCELEAGHEHEHEALDYITVRNDSGGTDALTPFLVWWADDGHAFVGSHRAVDTGRVG